MHFLVSCHNIIVLFSSSSVGESAPDRSGSLGEMARPGLQHQRGGWCHRRGRVPVPGRLCGSVRRSEAPPSPALLRILLTFLCLLEYRESPHT